MATLTPDRAQMWLDRWDAQQEHYIPDREERFAVIADVVATLGPAPSVIDLGAGPGSLSVRLLDRLPGARVVAVDADALLLGLARAAYGDRRGFQVLERDLRRSGWPDDLRTAIGGTVDAVVSTTALHWLTSTELAAVYTACARLLRPGGLLVNGDHVDEPADRPRLASLVTTVRESRRARQGVLDREDWAGWWDAVAAAPELAHLVADRGPRPIEHTVPEVPTLADHTALLRAAGFAEVGTVWQSGDDRVIVAVT